MKSNKREDLSVNPNSLHDFRMRRRGPKNIPTVVMAKSGTDTPSVPKDPGHPYANTKHISFQYFDQRMSNASFGYEHYVSLPPTYEGDIERTWPLILFLHGAGESQRREDESYASIRHGIPKVILCYDKLRDGKDPPHIDIPLAPRLRKTKQTKQGDKSTEPVPAEVCKLVAERFVTVTPSLNMECGYGWNNSVLTALLDEIVQRYRIDLDRIHLTGFSMGGYGTWDLALHTPDRFASVMRICGGGDPIRAPLIKHISHWWESAAAAICSLADTMAQGTPRLLR